MVYHNPSWLADRWRKDASTDSVVCQKFEEPDLTHIELKLGHVDRYDNPALGMGATYIRVGRRLPLVSIYFFDLGHQPRNYIGGERRCFVDGR